MYLVDPKTTPKKLRTHKCYLFILNMLVASTIYILMMQSLKHFNLTQMKMRLGLSKLCLLI